MERLTSRRGSPERPALEGSLADFGTLQVLGLLARGRQTGNLQVMTEGPVLITLVDGAVSFATADPAQTVRHLLVAAGVVGEAAWDRAAAEQEGIGMAEALVRHGADAGRIRQVIQAQILDVVSELAGSSAGRFRFIARHRHTLGAAFVYPFELLEPDLRERVAEWDRLRAIVPSFECVPRLAAALPVGRSGITIDAETWRVLARVDGRRTVAALREGDGGYATVRRVAVLVEAGALELDGARPT